MSRDEAKPEQGEFTKYIRDAFEETKKVGTPAFGWMAKNLLGACDRIDQLEEQLKAKDEALLELQKLIKGSGIYTFNAGLRVIEKALKGGDT